LRFTSITFPASDNGERIVYHFRRNSNDALEISMRPALLRSIVLITIVVAAVSAVPAGHAQTRGTRTIYLVRHGIYGVVDSRDRDEGGNLTELGRAQAGVVAQRLKALTTGPIALHSSTMARARETAAIIGDMAGVANDTELDLCECTPPMVRQDAAAREKPQVMRACRTQLDQAFKRYFRPTQGPDSSDVLVCHGNVIRYLVCRVMGVDTRAWNMLRIAHCSITTVEVRSDGRCRLVSFDDVGHLPAEMVTFANVRPDSGSNARR
jgi:serine/threonine-protein phosphatase PGAM5